MPRLVTTTLVTGSNQSKHIVQAVIDLKHTKNYTLSIRLSTDGFCFAAHNPQADNQFAYHPYSIDPLKSLTANLKAAIKENELLRRTYAKVNVLVTGTNYTIVPTEYYAESYKRELYMQSFPQTTDNTIVLHNFIGEEQAVILFGIDRQLYQQLTQQYPKAEIYASVSPLVNFGVEKSYASSNAYCLTHLHKRHTDLLCFMNGAPLFVNTFANQNTADTLYFLLNCWQTMGLSQLDDSMHLAGTSRHIRALCKELESFIKNIHIIHPAEEFHSTELARIGEIPFDLQALIACE